MQVPERVATVEVACALEGLADTMALLVGDGDGDRRHRLQRYARAAHAAVGFLEVRLRAGLALLGGVLGGHSMQRPCPVPPY